MSNSIGAVAGFGLMLMLPAFGGGQLTSALAQSADSTARARTVTVVPGADYRAGWLHRFLLGDHYRDLWTTPVEVEVLDLETFAGGLRPSKRGGGQQTRSLRFQGGDGREYAFRSVDKDPSSILPPELRGTAVGDVVRDQISAGHPVAALVVAPLLQAAGVLHPKPRLALLPDGDPRLGAFEAEFGGMLGIIEERPDEPGEDQPGFAGASKVIGTDKLIERLDKGPDDVVDARAFLTARLVDLFLGDWDRHRNQWRWARFGDEKPARWVPIPRDRDQAFARYDGLLLTVARGTAPQLVNFGPDYPGMLGLTWNGRDLDRRFLVPLERPTFDSAATQLQSLLTDAAIEGAVARLPDAYLPLDSARMAEALKRRRDRLPEAAERYYRHLAGQVDVYATHKSELVVAERQEGGVTELSIRVEDGKDAAAEPYFRRRFDQKDTREVRLYLQGGDDRVVVRGASGLRLRVIGGGGNDVVADSSRGGGVRLYATEPGDSALSGGVKVSRKPYRPTKPAQRDWGHRWLGQIWLSSGPDIGLFLGSGVTHTRFGFRQDPYAQRYRLRGGYATGASTVRVEFSGERHWPNSQTQINLLARASGIDVLRFHDFGNETSAEGPSDFFRVNQVDYSLAPSISFLVAPRLRFGTGPVLKYSRTDFDANRFISTLRPYGSGNFGMLGLQGTLVWDSRNRPSAASHGAVFTAGGGYYPAVLDVEEQFGEVHGEAATFLTADSIPLQPTLALRAGGKRVWGRFPFQESAFIGGNSTVRLGRENRYAGDASLYAGAELRLFLTRFYLIVPGDFGVFGLADVGRVYLDGESSDRWHGAAGGGIWFAFLNRANTISVALARSSERTGVYIKAGFGF
ncbi:MAG: hypothetical protein ACREMX_04135 [Gemmatimonadales bacterium]